MKYSKMLKDLLRDLVGVEREYRRLRRNVEDFCNLQEKFKAKDLFDVAKAIVDGKFTYQEFAKEYDKQYEKAIHEFKLKCKS